MAAEHSYARKRPRRRAALASGIAAAILLTLPGRAAFAAAAPPSVRAQSLAVDGIWLSVANLDRSLGFYRDIVGLPLQSPDTPAADAMLRNLTALPGARVRSAVLGSGVAPLLRLAQFSVAGRRVLRPHSVDPGAAMLEINVSDLDAVLRAAARAHTPMATRAAAPVRLPDGSRAVVLIDPDGYFVALFEPPSAARSRTAAASLLGVRFTVALPATMVRFYQQTFGIPLRAGDFMNLGDWTVLLGQPTGQWAVTEVRSAGAVRDAEGFDEVQFVAFRRVPRHTFSGRPQDPGTPTLSLRVTNLAAALRAIRSAGLRVLSAGGQPIPLPGGGAAVLFRDPAGVLVDLIQR